MRQGARRVLIFFPGHGILYMMEVKTNENEFCPGRQTFSKTCFCEIVL